MTELNSLNRWLVVFWNSLSLVVSTCFVLMLVVMGVQIFARYSLGVAVPWTDEAARYFFLAQIFLGAVLAHRHAEHIRVTVLLDILPKHWQRWLGAIADAVSIVVLILLMLGAIKVMGRTTDIYASTFRLSFSYLYLIQATSMMLMIMLCARDLYLKVRGRALAC